MSIKILCASGATIFAEGIAELINKHKGINSLANGVNIDEVLLRIAQDKPDILLLDVDSAEGCEIIKSAHEIAPEIKVIVVVDISNEPEIIAFAESGVAGFVPKNASIEDLIEILETASLNEAKCLPKISAILLQHVAALASDRQARAPNPVDNLTSREREILELINLGLSNKEIAVKLFIEISTVKNHVHNILQKLRVARRSQAIKHLK